MKKRSGRTAREKVIAVMGAAPGAGVSHVCLTLANYLASGERERVTYLEVGSRSDIFPMVENGRTVEGGHVVYRRCGVTYYPGTAVSEAVALLDSIQGYVILDITEWADDLPSLLQKCGRRILLGSLKPWRREQYGMFVREKIIKNMDKEQMEYFGFGLRKEEKAWFMSHFCLPVRDLPLLSDPFSIRREDFPFLRQFLFG